MKKTLISILLVSLLILAGCGDSSSVEEPADVMDHHAGEENVEPHSHDDLEVEPHDDSGQPPHRH